MRELHVTTMSESAVLDYFWQAANSDGVDRLQLLDQLATVVIPFPPGVTRAMWVKAAREETENGREGSTVRRFVEGCFACSQRPEADDYKELHGRSGKCEWHHVIWVSHGGSGHIRNQVRLCLRCHAHVHPWVTHRDGKRIERRESIAEMMARLRRTNG